MANWQEQPMNGQSVWHEHKNGRIERIDAANKTVYCDFYDHGSLALELDEFFGCFDEQLNQWVLIPL